MTTISQTGLISLGLRQSRPARFPNDERPP